MKERLEYGIETEDMSNRLFIDVPASLAVRMQGDNPTISEEIEELSASKIRMIDLEPKNDSIRLLINTKKIGLKKGDHGRRTAARRIVGLISAVDTMADSAEKDQDINVQMGTGHTSDGRLHMRAEVKWPVKSPDRRTGDIATHFMRDCAQKLRYERHILDELVYAQVVRERGVVVETNPLGSCNIGAGGYMYYPELPTVELYQHNLYSPIQQLICFTGALAIAKADILELPVDT